ncbi:MAG TPA: primosomal protein N' [Ktedonobacteraceae bacterium]|nr:primosomal protein N' [Ktedonobacteraceae bacterium]
MFADVLTSAASWNSEPLLTYAVPPEIAAEVMPGQLVAIPYGERLVEGIIWRLHEELPEEDQQPRPLSTLLDPLPALLPHQRALAEWIAEYYVSPLAHAALMMLPPGLMQRSKMVLQLIDAEAASKFAAHPGEEGRFTRLRALIGLLLGEGPLDIARLKEMLGEKKARALIKEAQESGLIERGAELHAPKAQVRRKRVVYLLLRGAELETWRRTTQERLQQSLPAEADPLQAVESLAQRPRQKKAVLDPWALPAVDASLALTPQNQAGLVAQRQLAAIDLLEHDRASATTGAYWTPHLLMKASSLTAGQLQRLVREGIIAIEEVEVQRDPLLGRVIAPSQPLPLTADQRAALQQILSSRRPVLLHGVTGSGKTEVYLQALEAVLARGQRGIVLVPEIALTTQAVQRIAGRFPGRVAIMHGSLSAGERYDEWRRIREGRVDVVIGSRTALFAPVPDLGILILDEEHEPAYKQSERAPTYHARTSALALSAILDIPLVLGSATPSTETYFRAERGEYQLVELPQRIGATLPPVEIVDLRNELLVGNTSILSRRLQTALNDVLKRKQQAILYLNRRGAASCVLCRECGYVAMCEQCDIPLTYHATERVLLCHYCNTQHKPLRFCPQCHGNSVRYFGLGTEKVEQTIARTFPGVRLLRWDRDTAKTRRAHEQLLDRFANREGDILIGTQMIAKGLDIPGVTLVGVVSADIALTLPDFSASERAFTLLTQVAGRAGRGSEAGRVIVQTFNPQHFCIDAASRHSYHEFYAAEIEARRRYGYPPFRQFVKLTYSHENRLRAQNEALLLREKLDRWIERLGLEQTDIVGPAPAIMERLQGKYRWQLILRGHNLQVLLRVLHAPGWQIDIEPVSMM